MHLIFRGASWLWAFLGHLNLYKGIVARQGIVSVFQEDNAGLRGQCTILTPTKGHITLGRLTKHWSFVWRWNTVAYPIPHRPGHQTPAWSGCEARLQC